MCYLLFKPVGAAIDPSWLDNAFDSGNCDGFGFAYVDNGKPTIRKYMSFHAFLTACESIPTHVNAVIHLRMASTGKVCKANAHPFAFGDLIGAHNGCLFGYGDDSKTDTEDFFQREVLHSSNLITESENLGRAIGHGKMVFLDSVGNPYILNEDKGEWFGGCWHSNQYYKNSFRGVGFYGEPETEETDAVSALLENLYTVDQNSLPRALARSVRNLIEETEQAYQNQNSFNNCL